MTEKNAHGANGAKGIADVENVADAAGRCPNRAASVPTALPAVVPTALLAVLTALALAISLALPAGAALASGAVNSAGDATITAGDAAGPADGIDEAEEPVGDCDTAFYRMAYLGPEGTFSEEAAFMVDGACMYVEREPVASVAEAVQLAVEGGCDFAVVPVENTVGGPVYGYLDELLAYDELGIWCEVELPVRQALVAAPGVGLGDVEVVYSHAQDIAQTQAWLVQNLPNAQVVEVASTGEAARMAAEDAEGNAPVGAAVASTWAAEMYGLDVLAEDVQLNDANVTRFYVVSAVWGGVGTPAERIAFCAAGSVADLPALLRAVDDQGLALVSLHGRPAQTELGDYVYLVECAAGGESPATCGEADFDAIAAACDDRFDLRFLGAFDVKRG